LERSLHSGESGDELGKMEAAEPAAQWFRERSQLLPEFPTREGASLVPGLVA
jgi:hypothetical protein